MRIPHHTTGFTKGSTNVLLCYCNATHLFSFNALTYKKTMPFALLKTIVTTELINALAVVRSTPVHPGTWLCVVPILEDGTMGVSVKVRKPRACTAWHCSYYAATTACTDVACSACMHACIAWQLRRRQVCTEHVKLQKYDVHGNECHTCTHWKHGLMRVRDVVDSHVAD